MFAQLKQSLSVWLIKKVQRYGPHRVQVLGNVYEISEEVFNPKYYYTSRLMAKHIKVKPDDIVLDIGTGSGIQAITAARTASRVIAIDINPGAVRLARKNIRTNGLADVVSVLEGDLFSPLLKQSIFSVILFTPPYMEGIPKTNFDHALFDPDKELIKRFFNDAKEYIKPDGYIQMIYSSIARPEAVLNISGKLGWNHKLIAQDRTFTERFLIYKLTMV